jgi:hypothetical protein
VGVVPAGTGGLADQSPASTDGWVHLYEPQPGGWVATRDGETELVTVITQRSLERAEIARLQAGPDGFTAQLWAPGRNAIGFEWLASPDGASWEAAGESQIGGWRSGAMAWGPAGWLTISQGNEAGGLWVWRSDDGVAWESLGRLPQLAGFSQEIVGSEWGYLMDVDSGDPSRGRFWYSPDGRSWLETGPTGLDPNAFPAVVGTADGFYVWNQGVPDVHLPDGRIGSFLPGGERTWLRIDAGPGGSNVRVVGHADGMLAVDGEPGTGAARIWTASVDGDRLAWRRDAAAEPLFAGYSVIDLAAADEQAYAIGWHQETEKPFLWTLNQGEWRRQPMHGFLGMPVEIAAGPAGVVVLGQRPSLLASNPLFWHLNDDGAFEPERSPVVRPRHAPDPGDCPGLPADAVELMATGPELSAACFGSAPITVRLWAVVCDQCWSWSGDAEPGWLIGSESNQLSMSPFRTEEGGGWGPAVLRPPVELPPELLAGAWVQVTGHYDDPAAQGCRLQPDGGGLPFYQDAESIILACRQMFAVTELTLVEGP